MRFPNCWDYCKNEKNERKNESKNNIELREWAYQILNNFDNDVRTMSYLDEQDDDEENKKIL